MKKRREYWNSIYYEWEFRLLRKTTTTIIHIIIVSTLYQIIVGGYNGTISQKKSQWSCHSQTLKQDYYLDSSNLLCRYEGRRTTVFRNTV